MNESNKIEKRVKSSKKWVLNEQIKLPRFSSLHGKMTFTLLLGTRFKKYKKDMKKSLKENFLTRTYKKTSHNTWT